jgi:cellulose synthase/poly-beta-1,6-N-acetylglucosamine synthase-like glycosyltransferase
MEAGAYGVYAALFVGLYFEVFLLISFFEKRPAGRTAAAPKHYPTVDIVVPCWNEERTLGSTLDSLLAMEYPKDKLSVVVVDDGSTDGTGAIASRYAKESPQVKYYRKDNGGKWTALNYAIERSSADIIGCLDADSFAAPDALCEVIKKFEDDPATMAITPAMKVSRPRNLLEMMQSVEYTFGIFYKKMFDNIAAINVLPGPFSFYKREIFATIGLFKHAHNTEDMEIAFRLHEHGLKISNAHTAHVYTTVPSTVRALIRQRTRWSQGFLQNSRDYAHMYFNRKYGNFGVIALPFGLTAFAAGLYTAGYALYHLVSFAVIKVSTIYTTGIPLHLPSLRFDWFYADTSMMLFLVAATLVMTLVAILLGQRIAGTKLSFFSFASYFLLFGFVAPVWLARAAWGALLAQESAWR